jgi:hypothetical protein
MDNPNHDRDTPGRTIRKLTLPDGFRVGIVNLDNILQEVADMKLTDTQAIKQELLEKVQACNYVASGAENEYAAALLQEYRRKFGEPGEIEGSYKNEIHQHTKG